MPKQKTNREAFLRDRASLLAEHKEEYIAYYQGQFLMASRDYLDLSTRLNKHRFQEITPDVHIDVVNEEAFDPPSIFSRLHFN